MLNSIAWSQCVDHKYSFSDGCKIYTRVQRKDCQKCYVDLAYADSIIMSKDSIIEIQGEFVESSTSKITSLSESLNESEDKYTKMKKKRNRTILIGVLGGIGTFVLGVLII